jgi:hypothetical protein
MAYMRGDYYIWSDGVDRVHLWVKDGYDGWDRCYEGEQEGTRRPGWENASGVCLPGEVMDEFVVMRLAQLILDGTVGAAIDRAVDPHGRGGSFGGMVLQQNAERLKAALVQIPLKMPEPSAV